MSELELPHHYGRRADPVRKSYVSDVDWQAALKKYSPDDDSVDDCTDECTSALGAAESLPRAKTASSGLKPSGFASRLLVQLTLPHSKPDAGEHVFERKNGHDRVVIIADPKYGLPYGTYPRLLLAYIVTEVVRSNGEREIEMGRSARAFLRNFDLGYGSGARGAAPRMREHMQRLFTSTIAAERHCKGKLDNIGFRPIERAQMFWDPANPGQENAWENSVLLSQSFVDEILKRPVPIHMPALRALSKTRSPMAIDIYQWLTYRMSYTDRPVLIRWDQLQMQFGGSYKLVRQFKSNFVLQLKKALKVYTEAKVEVTAAGLRLFPSPTHVLMSVPRSKHNKK